MGKRKDYEKIVYSTIIADIFHYGHLQSLKFANSQGDYHICGILTDKAASYYKKSLISGFHERKSIVSSLNFIDEVMVQSSKDPTQNLKKIHKKFPDAKIALVHGDDWRNIPGEEYIKKIGGKTITHPYYTKLSDFEIINKFIQRYRDKFSNLEEFTKYFQLKDFTNYNPRKLKGTVFSSKADALNFFKPLLKKSRIEDIFAFTVLDWKEEKGMILKKILKNFSQSKIVARSSALNEDSSEGSMAGSFHSELNIPSNNREKIEASINRVVESYNRKKSDFMINQILIQKQTLDVDFSGVVFTRTMEGYPYYVINYDDGGSTDSVTKGREGRNIKISRFCEPSLHPKKFKGLMESVLEIESIIPNAALDIEFAVTKGKETVIFQIRPLAALTCPAEDYEIKSKISELKRRFTELSKPQKHLAGDANIFGDMPDWNPAEIIGDSPNHLDFSLYNYILMESAWHEARASQGYSNVSPANLVVLFGNKPFVNIRNTFNSFIPATISIEIRKKLVDFFFEKLSKNPQLQDKVEFDIVYSCYDLSFDDRSKELLENGFTTNEVDDIRKALLSLTNNLIRTSKNSVWKDMNKVYEMSELRDKINSEIKKDPILILGQAKLLLDDCRKNGTVQFSRLARLAFIGKIILKSMVKNHTISQDFYDSFMNSVNTVAKKMNYDFELFINEKMAYSEFFRLYGHLRPGTYDITSLRYDKNRELFKKVNPGKLTEQKSVEFRMDEETGMKISAALKKNGLEIGSKDFIEFARTAIEARELSKFEFTKSLSDAIELIADAGALIGFSREELAMLDTNTLFCSLGKHELKSKWKEMINQNSIARKLNNCIILPPLVFSEKDFDVVSYYAPNPNFITQKIVHAEIAEVTGQAKKDLNLKGKIILLESGDPGYDWIFTKNPAGLITKYGGVASHMSIRSAEFGLPAAIGCGDIFDSIRSCKFVILDCSHKKIMLEQK